MPTLSFIYEGANDRILAGTTSVDGHRPEHQQTHDCPFCRERYATAGGLGDHLAVDHVGQRPFLQLAGIEPSAQDTIRQLYAADTVILFNCTALQQSEDARHYEPCDPATLAHAFQRRNGRLWLRLQNRFDAIAAPIHQDYDLSFRAPDAATLAQVDHLFVDLLGLSNPTMGDVASFTTHAPSGAASDYVDALAAYVTGMLEKDGDPTSGTGARRAHRSLLIGALQILQTVDRPLARLLAAVIRFTQNDFSQWDRRSGVARLDAVNRRLGPLTRARAARGVVDEETVGDRILPIDHGTHAVLARAEQLALLQRWGEHEDADMRFDPSNQQTDAPDRLKLAALWAERALALGEHDRAIEPLAMLEGDHCFGQWVDTALQESRR